MAVEIEEENSQRESDKKSPLFWGGVVTVLYFAGFAAFLFFFGKHPSDRLDLNEVGDFFAGLAGPLAFIWLVVAVIVQSRELAAQREELKLNRQELKLNRKEYQLNRKVLAEQGVEQKKQTEMLETQSEVTNKAAMIEELNVRIKAFVINFADEFKKIKYMQNGTNNQMLLPFVNMKVFNEHLAGGQMQEAISEFNGMYYWNGARVHEKYNEFGDFTKLSDELNKIFMDAKILTPHFDGYQLHQLKEGLDAIIATQKEFEKNNP